MEFIYLMIMKIIFYVISGLAFSAEVDAMNNTCTTVIKNSQGVPQVWRQECRSAENML
jgi:hypothetical protein